MQSCFVMKRMFIDFFLYIIQTQVSLSFLSGKLCRKFRFFWPVLGFEHLFLGFSRIKSASHFVCSVFFYFWMDISRKFELKAVLSVAHWYCSWVDLCFGFCHGLPWFFFVSSINIALKSDSLFPPEENPLPPSHSFTALWVVKILLCHMFQPYV